MSILKIHPLRSSSKGNASLILSDSTKILVDCGISCKALSESLSFLGLSPENLDAVLITHEHTDHTKGVGVVSRKLNIPIYANAPTWDAIKGQLGIIATSNIRTFTTNKEFYINDIKITSFETSHDAAESVGYVFETKDSKVAIATDMGVVTDSVIDILLGSDIALIEANYDQNLLEIGSYPYELKCRIKSSLGHLCNDDSGALAQILAESGTKEIILGHLSEDNNFPQLALKTVENFLANLLSSENPPKLSVVTRDGKLIRTCHQNI